MDSRHTRQQFLRQCSALGLGAVFGREALALDSQSSKGKVVIIGAGAAGLTAGFWLNRMGIEVQILEASDRIGGRLRKLEGFADYPIDLGGEWIHTHPRILEKITSGHQSRALPDTIKYEIDAYRQWTGHKWKSYSAKRIFPTDYKFVRSTWADFLATYLVPPISDSISLNTAVAKIAYGNSSESKVVIKTVSGAEIEADAVLVTASLAVLKSGIIQFDPVLPADKQNAIRKGTMPGGLKAFFKFSEKFFPLGFGLAKYDDREAGDIYYYDPGFGQDSDQAILGLFAYGKVAEPLLQMSSDQVKRHVLGELDGVFSGAASRGYQAHVVQNWQREPFVRGAYSDRLTRSIIKALARPLAEQVYFAGEAIPKDRANWGYAHGAALSGADAATQIARVLG